jgi:translation elongation factor EF-1beta
MRHGAIMSDDREYLLARLDERVKHIEAMVQTLVTRVEFMPVRAIAFGLAGLILCSVIAAVVATVLHK